MVLRITTSNAFNLLVMGYFRLVMGYFGIIMNYSNLTSYRTDL